MAHIDITATLEDFRILTAALQEISRAAGMLASIRFEQPDAQRRIFETAKLIADHHNLAAHALARLSQPSAVPSTDC